MRLKKDSGFTLIELLVVVGLIGILAAICAHHVLRARAVANEASAIGTVRAVASAQQGFAATCGGGFYADSLTKLVAGRFVSADANLSPKSGYVFVLAPGTSGITDCEGQATATTFLMTAVPLSGNSGSRGFAVNQHGTVWQDTTGTAPAEPFQRTANIAPIQ